MQLRLKNHTLYAIPVVPHLAHIWNSVVKSEEEAADTGSLFTHFICLALSLLSMKQMERHCIITRVERARQPSSLKPSSLSRYLPVFPRLYAQKHPGGVASMTRDRGYPDWLVLSARLLLQPRLKIVQNIYVLVVFGLWLCEDITACCYM